VKIGVMSSITPHKNTADFFVSGADCKLNLKYQPQWLIM